ncbi:MAG: hypothetical protein U0V18_07615 [Anaerolineales bacterium]
MEGFLGLLGCFALPIGLFVAVILGALVFWFNRQSDLSMYKQREDRRAEIGSNAVMAPAVVISARNGVVKSSRMWMTFEVEVQPEGRPPFRATVQGWVLLQSRNFVSWGERKEEIGQKIWVTYDANDPTKIIYEHYDVDHRVLMGRKAFEKIYERNKVIRETGEEAVARILEVEDLNLHVMLEREYNPAKGHYMFYKVEVSPNSGAPYLAEFQSLIKPSSLPKFEVGKKCYVKFDPQDRSQVCISRAME